MSLQADNTTVAKALQNCAVAWLEAGAEFSGVPIIGRRRSNIVNDIEAAIAELGACIFVHPGLPVHFIDAGTPVADRYQLRVRVIENPAINTALPDVFELVELVVRRLYGTDFPSIGVSNPLVFPQGGNAVAEVSDAERLIYDVLFETDIGFLPRVDT
jgi:hypothetical protein